MRKRHSLLAIFTLGIVSFSLLFSSSASAMSWNAGKIIDDIVFTNSHAMDPGGIQNFLNSKVPTCDTWGTQPSEFGGGTRAEYGAAHGNPAPFICLKDYSEGGRSAAQIIYDTAQEFQINPQVLIVLLQKEQGLVTDTWPLAKQYRTATGYGCPDSTPGVCNSEYYGFTNQLRWAGRMFRAIMNSSPTWYTPYVLGNNYIQYNPDPNCGGSNVNIENRSTQALYNYTPYQPNQAALDAGWGTAPCGAYGNRNFKLYFESWFGPTTDANLYFAVIKSPDSPALYLQTSAGKYYIPSGEILQAWGLDKQTVKLYPQSYIDSLPNHDWLERLLKDDWGNLFFVDNARLHYIRSGNYLNLWNLNPNKAAQSLGLAYTIPGAEWTGRFVRDISQPNGQVWLMDKGKKRAVPNADLLYQWGYTGSQLTPVTTAYLNSLPTGDTVTRYGTAASTNYLIDMGRRITFSNSNIEDAYLNGQAMSPYDSTTLSLLPATTASQFALNSSNGQWYMLEAGKRHYIPSAAMARVWGKKANDGITSLSNGYIMSLTDGGTLTSIVQTSNPSMYWLVDDTKHYISNAAVANAWLSGTPPVYSNQSLNLLSRGSDATTVINGHGSPYTYLMDTGKKRYLTSSSIRDAWGDTTLSVTNELVGQIPEGSFIGTTVKSNSGQGYIIMDGKKYPVDASFNSDWGIGANTAIVSDNTLSRYTTAATLKPFIRIGNTSYIVTDGGKKVPIQKHADAYQSAALGEVVLAKDPFPTLPEASYLIKSSDTNDGQVWLVTGGKKLLLSTFEHQVSYGYLSQGIQPTKLSPATLDLIPNDTRNPSLLIQKPGSGIKFISFGRALSFPDGATLTNYIGTSNQILEVSPSVFDSFVITQPTSRTIKDDQGRYYLMDAGSKRYIPNQSVYVKYNSNPLLYLQGTTMNLIPNGQTAN